MELWLVRHAETEWSRVHRHTGRTDIPLTEEGRAHARTLQSVLAAHPFALALSSPLMRARETAELAGFGDRIALREGLLEFDYGDYEGISTKEIRTERPEWYLWRDGSPGGETPDDVGVRVDPVIDEALGAGGDVVLFAHGHLLRALAARWLELPAAFGGQLALSTGAICVLGFEREARAIWRWNDVVGIDAG